MLLLLDRSLPAFVYIDRGRPLARPFMRSTRSGTFGVLFALCLALPASAQNSVGEPAPNPASPVLTGKERLGPKWTDEQRIDNCNVPVDKRGTKPRPGVCPHAATR
jgi:hypothetical protein